MPTITISPGFRIVIPKPIREQLRLAPGQRMLVIG